MSSPFSRVLIFTNHIGNVFIYISSISFYFFAGGAWTLWMLLDETCLKPSEGGLLGNVSQNYKTQVKLNILPTGSPFSKVQINILSKLIFTLMNERAFLTISSFI